MDKPKPQARVIDQMHLLGVLLWGTGCVRLYRDGDGFSFLFRVWHPVTWLITLVMVVPCAVMGERLFEVIPLRLKPYWVQRRRSMQWVQPWSPARNPQIHPLPKGH